MKQKLKHLLRIAFSSLFMINISAGQSLIVDSCFSSSIPNTGFSPSPDLESFFNSDLLEWTGSNWVGCWPNANLTIPPPTQQIGCRAIFIGSGSVWTTGGEAFGMRLSQPLVGGQVYSFFFTYVSHGFGSDGSFSPKIYSNVIADTFGEIFIDSLIPAGYNWYSSNFSFTASPSQNGHSWILVQSDASGSSGIVSSFCVNCAPLTGIPGLNTATSIDVFPNPFVSEISIAVQNQNMNQVAITIKSILGQTVYIEQENNLGNGFTKTIGLDFLSKGIYMLDVNIDGERTVKRIVKE